MISLNLAERAAIILALMDGKSGYVVSRERGCDLKLVYRWRNRFLQKGVAGLVDLPRSGQPRKITPEKAREVLDKTMHAIPRESTRWSTRLMAKYTGLTPYLVGTVWKAAKIRPHLTSTFNISKDPAFAEKVADIVGLYLRAPEGAIVLSVDEKTQIQALDHTQPMLQLRPGQVERHTHDYVRHGTTNLYAAFDIQTGRAIGAARQRHRAKEFIAFLNLVDRRLSARKHHSDIHIILDNSSTYKTAGVDDWRRAHPNYVFHFTPTSASWLNAVEGWFSRLERFGLRDKAFKSVAELRASLREYIVNFNRHSAKPFVWTKSAESILVSAQHAKDALAAQNDRVVIGPN